MAKSKPIAEPTAEPSITLDETTPVEPTEQALTPPAVEPAAEPPPAAPEPKKVKDPACGIYDTVVVIDKDQFTALIRNLTHGYVHDYYGLGLLTQVQRMFRIKNWEDAKTLFNTFMKG